MAQIQPIQRKDNSAAYSQAGSAAGNAVIPGVGGILGGMVGAQAGNKGIAPQPLQAQQAQFPQAPPVEQTQVEDPNGPAAMQRRLALLNTVAAQNQGT